MNVIELKQREAIPKSSKLNNAYTQLASLLNELREKDLPPTLVEVFNTRIQQLNSVSDSKRELRKAIRNTQNTVIKELEKQLKIVPKNYYRNVWMALGMAAFGVPIGVAMGLSMHNIGMLAVGIPIGMVIGMGIGIRMDKKAFEEGRQLDFDLKY